MSIIASFRRSFTATCLALSLVQYAIGRTVASSNVAILEDIKALAAKHSPLVSATQNCPDDSALFQNNTLLSRGDDADHGDAFHRYQEIEHGFNTRLNITDPFDAWDTYQLAEPFPYWTKNMRSVMESNTSEWFMLFLDNYAEKDSFHCRQRGLSQVGCFAYIFSGVHNYHCRVDQPYRCHLPQAQAILEHISKAFPSESTEFKVTLARRVYFVFLNLQQVQANFASTKDFLETVSAKLPEMVPRLVETFTPQVDKVALLKCDITKKVIKMAVEVALKAATMGMNFWQPNIPDFSEFTDPGLRDRLMDKYLGKWKNGLWLDYKDAEKFHQKMAESNARIADINKKAFESYKALKLAAEKPKANINKAIEVLGQVHGKAWDVIPQLEKYPSGSSRSSRLRADRLGMSAQTATGFCGNVFGVTPEENAVREKELMAFTLGYLDDLRYGISETFEKLMDFNPNESDNYILRMFMGIDQWKSSVDITNSQFRALEKLPNILDSELENNLEAYLIRELLSSSRCFMECNEVTKIEQFCPKSLSAKQEKRLIEEFQHRFCPDEKTVCKAECMSKKQYWNKKLPIISYKKLEAYGSSLADLMTKSWKHYNLHSNDTYEPQVLVKDGKLMPGESLLHIPVCYSKSDTIGSFNRVRKYRKRFPFSCGRTFNSEDTTEFFKDINVLTDEERNIRTRRVAEELINMEPVRTYLLMCQLNIHWPKAHPWEFQNTLVEGKDSSCDQIFAETKHMDEFEANTHFCNGSVTAYEIMGKEQIRLSVPVPGPKRLRLKCDKWTKSNAAEIQTRSSEIKKKYQRYLKDQAHADEMSLKMESIDKELATLRESLTDLPATNPDWKEIFDLAGMKIAFIKDLKELDGSVKAESLQQVQLREGFVDRITEIDIAVKGLARTSPDAIYIAQTAQKQLELDDEKTMLVEALKKLGLGNAKRPRETS